MTLPQGWAVPQKVAKLKSQPKKSNKTAVKKATIKAEATPPLIAGASAPGGGGGFR